MIDLQMTIDPDLYTWVVLPLIIFFARIFDVSLGTLRIIFLSRGRRTLAPIFGFFEVLIWIIVIAQIIRNVTHIVGFLAYAAGFAAGNYIGMLIEEKLAIGMLSVRTIMVTKGEELVQQLHEAGYGATSLQAEGAIGHVTMVYTIIKRKDLGKVVGIIKKLNPKAFFSVEEIRLANEGIFPRNQISSADYLRLLTGKLKK
jgi:uncharacterized protein YebE (UPF0316 family)